MGMFQTDLSADPFVRRLVWLIYGVPKVGKTSLILDMIEKTKDIAYVISADKGTKRAGMDPQKYKGRLAIAYPGSLREYRDSINEMESRIKAVTQKVSPERVWAVIDTINAMQIQLLAEGRKLSVTSAKSGRGRIEDADEYVRDAVTQVDYNVNLGLMAELTNAVMRLPCNVVFIALEKQEDRDGSKTAIPALSGQSKEKVTGDADVIARMTIVDGKRKLCIQPGAGWYAGDRTGIYQAEEEPDLHALAMRWRDKVANTGAGMGSVPSQGEAKE